MSWRRTAKSKVLPGTRPKPNEKAARSDGPDFGSAIAVYQQAELVLTAYEASGGAVGSDKLRDIKVDLEEAIDLQLAVLAKTDDERRPPFAMLLCGLYRFLGGAHMYLEEYGPAVDCYESARELGADMGFSSEVVQALNNMGRIAMQQGDAAEAARQLKRAVAGLDAETEAKFGREVRKNLATAESAVRKRRT
ncbi:MAG: tetratricopeptide repeat protein [Ilumatobacter sp.]|uniref:tetratricopeptide repeat protein n=1 Tax=Ilumatobacter sp. TaxID=1967498 RepID=UPI00260BCD9D|nr:tetratricopeptide repeat protein [Ilumatobacter sp.]MDJ0771557.1 tetratricopeptide repeat protein [Ilumatobacter sp.]